MRRAGRSRSKLEAAADHAAGRLRAPRTAQLERSARLLPILAATLLLACQSSDPVASRALIDGAASSSARESGRVPASTSLLEWEATRPLPTPGWVEVRAAVVASGDEPPLRARDRARERARRLAVEYLSGVSVETSVLTVDHVAGEARQSLLHSITHSSSRALVVEERLRSATLVPIRGGEAFESRVVVEARVFVREASEDPDFEIDVDLGAQRFLSGDAIELRVHSTRSARLYVISLSPTGLTIPLPSRHLPENRVEADAPFVAPPSAGARGVALRAQLPRGRRSVLERLLVLAVRGEPDPIEGWLAAQPVASAGFHAVGPEESEPFLATLLSRVVALPPERWAFAQTSYEILARSATPGAELPLVADEGGGLAP